MLASLSLNVALWSVCGPAANADSFLQVREDLSSYLYDGNDPEVLGLGESGTGDATGNGDPNPSEENQSDPESIAVWNDSQMEDSDSDDTVT